MKVYDFKSRLCFFPFAAAAMLVAFIVFAVPTPPLLEIRTTDWIAFFLFVAVLFALGYWSYRFIVLGVALRDDRVIVEYTKQSKIFEVQGLEEVQAFNGLFCGLLKIRYQGENVYAAVMIPFWRQGASETFERLVDELGYRTPLFLDRENAAQGQSAAAAQPHDDDLSECPDLFDPIPEETPQEQRKRCEERWEPSSDEK